MSINRTEFKNRINNNPSSYQHCLPKSRNLQLRLAIDRRKQKYSNSVYVKLFNCYGLSEMKKDGSFTPGWILIFLDLRYWLVLFPFFLSFTAESSQSGSKNLEISKGAKLNLAELISLVTGNLTTEQGKTTWSKSTFKANSWKLKIHKGMKMRSWISFIQMNEKRDT